MIWLERFESQLPLHVKYVRGSFKTQEGTKKESQWPTLVSSSACCSTLPWTAWTESAVDCKPKRYILGQHQSDWVLKTVYVYGSTFALICKLGGMYGSIDDVERNVSKGLGKWFYSSLVLDLCSVFVWGVPKKGGRVWAQTHRIMIKSSKRYKNS